MDWRFSTRTAKAVILEAKDAFPELLYIFRIQALIPENIPQHKTGYDYLVHNIIAWYLREDAKLADDFFDPVKGRREIWDPLQNQSGHGSIIRREILIPLILI